MAEIVHTEQVREGEKARYPFKSEYEEPTLDSYLFVGWKYKGTIYEPNQYASEASNPFGPITENTDILAMWSQVRVFCIPDKTIIGYEGGQIKIMYYAVTSRVVTSNDVEKQFFPPRVNPIQYRIDSDTEVSGQYRMCTINVTQNNDNEGRKLRVAATYKGVMSDVVEIYQQSPNEFIIPDCDYFHFTYSWEDNEHGGGRDLDSLTVIYVEDEDENRVDKSFTGKAVGYGAGYTVNASNGKLCLKHGGDCRLSGDETAVCCLTNIAETGEVSNLETIKINIYANWYSEDTDVTTGGNMTINCKAYKSKNPNGPDFATDIDSEEISETLPGGSVVTHERYTPNLNMCEEVWSESADFHVNACGTKNANQSIKCAGEIYSNIGTVIFRIGSNSRTFQKRTVDNGKNGKSGIYNIKLIDNNGVVNKNVTIDTQDTNEHTLSGLYFNYWGQDMNMFTNEQDSVNIYLSASSNTEVEIVGTQYRFNIDSTKLGQEFGVTETKLFSKFKVEKRADGKLNITYKVIPNIGNSRKIEIEFTKCFDDCTPKINNSTVYYIYQNP